MSEDPLRTEAITAVEVYLLPHRNGRFSLYSEAFLAAPEPESGSEPETTGSNLVTAAKRSWDIVRRTQQTLSHASRSREELLKKVKALSELERLRLIHPASLTGDDAGRIYRDLVADEIERHRRWLWVDGLLVPLSLIFTIIPGPNLLLAYLAWRSLAHYRTKKGGDRALSELQLELVPSEALDRLARITRPALGLGRRQRIRELGRELGLPRLDKAYGALY